MATLRRKNMISLAQQTIVCGIAAIALVGCGGKEVDRIVFEDDTPQEITVNLEGEQQVYFWVDLDVGYEGDAQLGYAVALEQNGAAIGGGNCNALDVNIQLNSVETSINGVHNKRYQGKMNCAFDVPQSGEVTVMAMPIAQANGLEVRKFDLVIKQ